MAAFQNFLGLFEYSCRTQGTYWFTLGISACITTYLTQKISFDTQKLKWRDRNKRDAHSLTHYGAKTRSHVYSDYTSADTQGHTFTHA